VVVSELDDVGVFVGGGGVEQGVAVAALSAGQRWGASDRKE
jgi:hypothetical protein